MPRETRKSKCEFRRIVAPEPVSASELDNAERLLARFVALAYAAEYPDLFTPRTDDPQIEPTFSSSAVTLVARTVSADRTGTV